LPLRLCAPPPLSLYKEEEESKATETRETRDFVGEAGLRKKQPASTVRGSGASSNEVLNLIAIRIYLFLVFLFSLRVCVCVCASLSLSLSLCLCASLSVCFFLFDVVFLLFPQLLFLLNSWSIHFRERCSCESP
jgi:hypothetical protein